MVNLLVNPSVYRLEILVGKHLLLPLECRLDDESEKYIRGNYQLWKRILII